MMMKKHITRTLIASAVLFSFNSTAATSYFEARNDAMRGTGVTNGAIVIHTQRLKSDPGGNLLS